MVRLKAAIAIFFFITIKLFQFLDGAIKRQKTAVKQLNYTKFQFLDGAIKRGRACKMAINSSEFQFLDGAIKSFSIVFVIMFVFISIP